MDLSDACLVLHARQGTVDRLVEEEVLEKVIVPPSWREVEVVCVVNFDRGVGEYGVTVENYAQREEHPWLVDVVVGEFLVVEEVRLPHCFYAELNCQVSGSALCEGVFLDHEVRLASISDIEEGLCGMDLDRARGYMAKASSAARALRRDPDWRGAMGVAMGLPGNLEGPLCAGTWVSGHSNATS